MEIGRGMTNFGVVDLTHRGLFCRWGCGQAVLPLSDTSAALKAAREVCNQHEIVCGGKVWESAFPERRFGPLKAMTIKR